MAIPRSTVQLTNEYLKSHIATYVVERQKEMVFGGINRHWPDVEVDEATFGKIKLNDNAVTWNNYIGLIHRGVPSSLVILKLPSRTTSAKSPGPGPLLLKHWVPIAERYIIGRGVILHTDSAKAYLKEFPRVAHTRVTSKTRKGFPFFFFFFWGGGVRTRFRSSLPLRWCTAKSVPHRVGLNPIMHPSAPSRQARRSSMLWVGHNISMGYGELFARGSGVLTTLQTASSSHSVWLNGDIGTVGMTWLNNLL